MTEAKTNADGRVCVVGLGELLWDIFPDGPRFGGAPANFACSTAALSNEIDVAMASAVGDDKLGHTALQELKRRSVDTSAVAVRSEPTGTVDVSLNETGHASYRFAEDTAWDCLSWNDGLKELSAKTQAVCFGTLGQRSKTSRETIQRFVQSTPDSALKIFDINLRPPFYDDDVIQQSLRICTALKLNDEELPLVAKLSDASGSDDELLPQIAERWELNTIALTLGASGAALWHDGKLFKGDGVETTVKDTVGAGDSFTATLAVGLLSGCDPQHVIERACEVAAFVCSQDGATPEFPARLKFS